MTEILTQFSSHITINTVSPSRCVRTTCAWARVRARTRVSVRVDGFTQPESKLRDQPEPWNRVTRQKVGTSLSSSPRRTQFEYSKPVNKLAIITVLWAWAFWKQQAKAVWGNKSLFTVRIIRNTQIHAQSFRAAAVCKYTLCYSNENHQVIRG